MDDQHFLFVFFDNLLHGKNFKFSWENCSQMFRKEKYSCSYHYKILDLYRRTLYSYKWVFMLYI